MVSKVRVRLCWIILSIRIWMRIRGLWSLRRMRSARFVIMGTMRMRIWSCFVEIVIYRCIRVVMGLSSCRRVIGYVIIVISLGWRGDWWLSVCCVLRKEELKSLLTYLALMKSTRNTTQAVSSPKPTWTNNKKLYKRNVKASKLCLWTTETN